MSRLFPSRNRPDLDLRGVRWLVGLAAASGVVAGLGGLPAADAASSTVLYRFQGGADGANPLGGLISDTKGGLYGTTANGGNNTSSNSCSGGSAGTVFQLKPPAKGQVAWSKTVIHAFQAGPGDGCNPRGTLVRDPVTGTLYGTTYGGGSRGYGTVYKLTPPATSGGAWSQTVLLHFNGISDGANPAAGMVIDSSNALYGTTRIGGKAGWGTVYKLSPPSGSGKSWTESVLHNFVSSEGGYPQSGVILSKGQLYGTLSISGTSGQYGSAFMLAPPASNGGTWTLTALHSFSGGSNGATPYGDLIVDSGGALYGSTTGNYGSDPYGSVFQLKPPATGKGSWTYSAIHSFTGCGQGAPSCDGAYPYVGVVRTTAGVLYGATTRGGPGWGLVYKLSPPAKANAPWTEAIVQNFAAGDGTGVYGGLLLSNNILYGTNAGLGYNSSGFGSVFKLVP